MVFIKEVSAKSILDSRGEKTILVSIKTNAGNFSASSPTGKSTGKFEAKPYKKDLETDIKKINQFSEYFSDEEIECFDNLKKIEEIVKGHIGANTLFALESAVLKSIAHEKKKEVWELINPNAKKMPFLVGNCIGGGKHSNTKNKRPDFQEFLLILKDWKILKDVKRKIEIPLKKFDENFKGEKNDENAWMTSLNEKEVLDILSELKIPLGVDIASSSFFKRKKYHYENPKLERNSDEQFEYISNLIENFELAYIEDPFAEEDFESFSKLLKKFPNVLIVGDDLTATNCKRVKKAIEKKSINGLIVKPNQIGSLIEVKEVCELAKKHNIKIIFSHRSGETEENILADLTFGFGADYFKCGIDGKEREIKIKRVEEIKKE